MSFAIPYADYLAAVKKAAAENDDAQLEHLIHDFFISDEWVYPKRDKIPRKAGISKWTD